MYDKCMQGVQNSCMVAGRRPQLVPMQGQHGVHQVCLLFTLRSIFLFFTHVVMLASCMLLYDGLHHSCSNINELCLPKLAHATHD